jgi:putative nucleotidyltransferase with HDIG domain
LSPTAIRAVADADAAGWAELRATSETLLADVLRDRIADGGVEEVLSSLPLRVPPSLPPPLRPAVVELTGRFVTANLVATEASTQRARQAARESVAPVVQVYERGQSVVRDGQVIGAAEIEALDAMGLRNPDPDWRPVGAGLFFGAILMAGLLAYLWYFDRPLLGRYRRVALIVATLAIYALAAKMVIPGRPLWVYVFPLPAATMLLTVLLDVRVALVSGALLSLIVAWVSGASYEVGVLGLAGGSVGALAVWRKERVLSYFLAGLYVALAQVLIYIAFFLASRGSDIQLLSLVSFELLVNGVLSALLAIGSIAVVGRLFGIATTLQLLELANPTQPLLRRLLMEAPGTYHHSIMVGNLAERAAEVIGADSLLVRVAAYYHDVGKLERPWVFIENQTEFGANIHDSLEPVDSAQLIAAHVPDGVSLAERFGLPQRLKEMIPQHHGTRTVSFFYQQAAERTVEELDPKLFTYQGPTPQSREAAILMLADSTEAASRTLKDHSRESIGGLVDQLIKQRLDEGQFDHANLSLQDLAAIKESFVTLLTGIYHARIPYPKELQGVNPGKPTDVVC